MRGSNSLWRRLCHISMVFAFLLLESGLVGWSLQIPENRQMLVVFTSCELTGVANT